MIKLSHRLQIVFDMIPHCHTLADVGTDHGYLPLAILENGVAQKAIAMDVNQGPLDKARKNLEEAGFSDKSELRLSDGLKQLAVGEAQVISICGMGGTLIGKIIKAGEEVAKSAECIIIEPQSDYYSLRKLLGEMGFVITDEDLTCEENKIYPIIKMHYEADVSKRPSYSDAELTYGPIIIQKAPELLLKLLDKNQKEYSSILVNLEKNNVEKSSAIELRCGQLRAELELIKQVQNLL